MKLIVLRLPKTTTENELRGLLKERLSHKFHIPFTDTPSIASCEIYEYRDVNGVTDFHGIVEIQPDDAALWLVKHFKSQHSHGKLVFIRPYYKRSQKKKLDAETDRRDEGIKIERKSQGIHVEIEALDQFKRTYK